ncbi:hypothetical protein Bbelb_373810 [Branchiostoma belcheri]|nr:hypothetical protein Bbelb_373810 [Branchiostoma belcheri]
MINTAGRELTLNIGGIPITDHKATANAINKAFCAMTCSLEQLDLGKLPTFLPAKPLEEIQPWDVYKKIGEKPKSRPPTTEKLRPISLTPMLTKVVRREICGVTTLLGQ